MRKRNVVESPTLNFNSNDYLGLSQHPKIRQAIIEASHRWGFGSTSSAFISGFTSLHEEFEYKIAKWLGFERALLFNSGYMANLALAQSFNQLPVEFFSDHENHASLNDSLRLSPHRIHRYKNMAQLDRKLQARQKTPIFITESVFSMSGRVANIPEIIKRKSQHNGVVIIDDAHGLGVLGKQGKGIIEHYNLQPQQINLLAMPLSKALAGLGGVLLGDHTLIEYIMQNARSYCYTTALPPLVVAGLIKSLDIIGDEVWRIEQLQENILFFQVMAKLHGLACLPSQTAIQGIVLPGNNTVLLVAQHLQQQNILVTPIRYPSVSRGSERLRIVLSADHRLDEIFQLVKILSDVLVC